MHPWMALRAASAALSPQFTPSASVRIALFERATTANASATGVPATCSVTGCRSYSDVAAPQAMPLGRRQSTIPATSASSSNGASGCCPLTAVLAVE